MASTAAPSPQRMLGRTELVVLMALLMSLNALGIDGILPALDDIAREFNILDPNERQLVVGTFLLATGIGSLFPGVMADRFGRKPLLMWGLAIFSVFSVASAVVTSFTWLLVVRAIQGFACASLMVVPTAIVRDKFDGDAMARTLSMITAVFIIVPVIAPTLGQLVLEVSGWRTIFLLLSLMGVAAAIWAATRLPETLHVEFRQPIEMRPLARNMYIALTSRAAIGYVVGSGLVIGTVFGYVNSAQQLLGEHFGAGDYFPYIFGATAATMAVSSLVNSRIVGMFGARRVSHAGLMFFILVSALQVWVANSSHGSDIAWFLPLMACNLALLGFLGANFSSIAMQPFAEIAGAASSIQAFIRMVMAAVIGIVIGQFYDGTARPLAWALFSAGVVAMLLVLYSEKGRLFRRLNAPKPKNDDLLTEDG